MNSTPWSGERVKPSLGCAPPWAVEHVGDAVPKPNTLLPQEATLVFCCAAGIAPPAVMLTWLAPPNPDVGPKPGAPGTDQVPPPVVVKEILLGGQFEVIARAFDLFAIAVDTKGLAGTLATSVLPWVAVPVTVAEAGLSAKAIETLVTLSNVVVPGLPS